MSPTSRFAVLVVLLLAAIFCSNARAQSTDPKPSKPTDVIEEFDKSIEAPKAIKSPDPKWPHGAHGRNALEILKVVIDTNGDVQDIQVVQSAGAGFDESATNALHKWKFKPARIKATGEPVALRLNIEIRFWH